MVITDSTVNLLRPQDHTFKNGEYYVMYILPQFQKKYVHTFKIITGLRFYWFKLTINSLSQMTADFYA